MRCGGEIGTCTVHLNTRKWKDLEFDQVPIEMVIVGD